MGKSLVIVVIDAKAKKPSTNIWAMTFIVKNRSVGHFRDCLSGYNFHLYASERAKQAAFDA